MWIQDTSTTFLLSPPFLVPTHLPPVPTPEKTYFTFLTFIFFV
jgi:hypothetical protein